MLGKTHVPVGITTALVVTHPTTVSGVIGAVAGGAVGGWICDIDVRGSSEKEGRVLGFFWMAIYVAVALGIDYFLGNGICDYMIRSWSFIKIIAVAVFVAGCMYGFASSHRTFTHSIVALIFFTGMIYLICEPMAVPFAAGFISHIVLDLFNRSGMQLFFPLKARISFDVCDSDGSANQILGGVATIASVVLAVIFLFGALSGEQATSNILDFSRQDSPISALSRFQLYLIVINIISFIAYVIDYLLCYNGVVSEDNEDALHDFLNLFAYIGGAMGALIALLILTQKGRANAYWFIKVGSILIAWIVIYMVVMDPLGIGGGNIKTGMVAHLPLAIYLIAINIVSAFLFIKDRFKRRSDMNSSEWLLLLVGAIGGAAGGYLVMILTNGKQRFSHFSVGLPVMMAVHALVIAYLVYMGIA